MTITFHATFAVGSLLLLLSMQPTAKADTFHVVAGVNTATCAAIDTFCPLPVSFTADFTTVPAFNYPYGYVNSIVSMTGTLNGFSSVGGPGGWLLGGVQPNNYLPLFTLINFTADGQQYQIGWDDTIAGSAWMEQLNFGLSYITWDATLVQTPEPSSLLLLLLGSGGLLVGLALFKNKSRTGVIV